MGRSFAGYQYNHMNEGILSTNHDGYVKAQIKFFFLLKRKLYVVFLV